MSSGKYFDIEIVDGYSIRQLFEFINKLMIEHIPVYFTEQGAIIRTSTSTDGKSSRRIIVNCQIIADDILNYYVNKDLLEETSIGMVHCEDFKEEGLFKNISKNYYLKISRSRNDELEIVTEGVSHKEPKLKPDIVTFALLDDFDDLVDVKANIHIPIEKFSKFLKNISKASFNEAMFIVSKEGLEIKTLSAAGAIVDKMNFGKRCEEYLGNKCRSCGDKCTKETQICRCDREMPAFCHNESKDCHKHFTTYVDSKIIKGSFQKLNGICGRSIIKFSACKNGYLKINMKLGDFGSVDIYLIDLKERS